MTGSSDESRLGVLTRGLSIRLTERPSVTGTPDEASFGPWLAGALSTMANFGSVPEIWSFPVAPDDARHCVAMLVRRGGDATAILTGHYDTVTVADYGDLAPLAIQPEALAPALMARLVQATGAAEVLAREDLASDRFLPGRGLLDMKAGLAAGLAAMADFATDPQATGNLLFLAVPDEENASVGARAAAFALGPMARERGLTLRAAINLDAMADDGDGSEGRIVALGTVGKVLPTALVVGAPVHSGYPLRGLNAAVLAGAIAARLEWASELTDESADEPGTPVSLLSLRDGKAGYDVTTPGMAWATWSVLNTHRDPATVLDLIEPLVREAVEGCVVALRERAARSGQPAGAIVEAPVPVFRYGDLLARVPDAAAALAATGAQMLAEGRSMPDIAHALTLDLWALSGLSGPAVVLGLGSTPYLATALADAGVLAAVTGLVADAPARHGVSLKAVEFFAGFFGQADAGAFARLAADTPAWDTCIGLGESSLAQVPTVNLGPWGRDYHTPLERIDVDYGFRVLPALLRDLCARILAA